MIVLTYVTTVKKKVKIKFTPSFTIVITVTTVTNVTIVTNVTNVTTVPTVTTHLRL